MNGEVPSGPSILEIEEIMCATLAQADASLAATRPVLEHILADGAQSWFSDEILARIRGMLANSAYQLVFGLAQAAQSDDPAGFAAQEHEALCADFLQDGAFITHAHALALEGVLADRLHKRSGIDPVLTPLFQELAASQDPVLAELSIHVLSAQARFMQQQLRMELPIMEMPGELFDIALQNLRNLDIVPAQQMESFETRLRHEFDQGKQRLGLMDKLLVAMGRGAAKSLALDHAGLAMFASGLAMANSLGRDHTVMSFGDSQLARFALYLVAAGLTRSAVEEQFLILHPDILLPDGFEQLTAERARDLLTRSEPS